MLDAETVITVAKKVKLKRDETKRRRVNRRALYMDISYVCKLLVSDIPTERRKRTYHWQFHGVVKSSRMDFGGCTGLHRICVCYAAPFQS